MGNIEILLPFSARETLKVPFKGKDLGLDHIFNPIENNFMNQNTPPKEEYSKNTTQKPQETQGGDYSFKANMESCGEGGFNLGRIDTGNGNGNGNGQSFTYIIQL
mmetsp:Transcript_7196/g.6386  ORF Transcript_7196/g.6386 Transcript_7196/m.6386 type:complete len:105 (+) Transcript_7196:553-867(+)